MHVLITGARAPACLELARAFHAEGWRVSVADSLALPLTRGSRFVKAYFRLPEPTAGAAKWGAALGAIIQREAVDIVIPTCEEAFYLSHQKPLLSKSTRIWVSDFQQMAMVHHKGKFAAMTAGWPIAAPESRVMTEPAQLAAFREDSSNWVFKPAFSRFAARTMIRPNRLALEQLRPTLADPWVAQRFVPGREYCTYSIMSGGRVHAHVCYHPKYRVGSGSGIFFERAGPTGPLAFVEHFARATQYAGQVGFDFIESPSGETFVLECNPRATSGVHLLRGQSASLVQAILGSEKTSPGPALAAGMIGMAMLVFGMPKYGLRKVEFWRDWTTASDAIAQWSDPGPAFMQLIGLTEIAWRSIRRRRTLLAAATQDIEWNGGPLDAE